MAAMPRFLNMIFVYTTFPNKKEAAKICGGLIKKRLAACVNIFPIESIYFWEGKITKDKEFAAIIKTPKAQFKKIEKFIIAHHSYDTPCVVEIPVGAVAKRYLDWANKVVELKHK